MEFDKNYTIYFWVDHVVTPRWQKRSSAVDGCFICKTRITKASPHCHLCGLLMCRECITHRHLPPRFNKKQRPSQDPLSVCVGCVEQVQTRRLALLSEASSKENQPLSDYIDLPVVYPSPSKTSDKRSASHPMYNMAHIFIGIRKTFTIRQLYNILIHNREVSHMHQVVFTYQDKLVTNDSIDKVTAAGLLPRIHLASEAQCKDPKNRACPTPLTKQSRVKEVPPPAAMGVDTQKKPVDAVKPSSLHGSQPTPSAGSTASASTHVSAPVLVITGKADTVKPLAPPVSPVSSTSQSATPRGQVSTTVQDTKDKKKKKGIWVQAMHSYINTKPGKILSFAKGDKLRVINKKSDEWWFAVTEHGETKGWIPAQYVKELQYSMSGAD